MARIRIVLEIEGDQADALTVIGELLDAGIMQDDINDHEFDAGQLRVVSAVCEPHESAARPAEGLILEAQRLANSGDTDAAVQAMVRAVDAFCDEKSRQAVERDARGIPLTYWPHLRDYSVSLILEHVGARMHALRADGAVAVLSMFTDRHLDIELVDNGGELRVLHVERTPFGPDVPLSAFGRPCGPLTLAYRIRSTILGDPIDYEADLDREKDR
jgi:hypothetical protein